MANRIATIKTNKASKAAKTPAKKNKATKAKKQTMRMEGGAVIEAESAQDIVSAGKATLERVQTAQAQASAPVVATSARVARQSVFQAVSKQVGEGMKDKTGILQSTGLDWTVESSPLIHKGREFPQHQIITRTDTGNVLAVMGKRYETVQNSELLDFADDVFGKGQRFYESGGELHGGRKVFFNCILPGHLFVKTDKADKIEKRVLAATSHDGSAPVILKLTTIRVVCQNTFNAALREKTDEIRLRHTPNFEARVSQAQKALGLIHAYYDDLQGVIDILATSEIKVDGVAKMGRVLLGIEGKKNIAPRQANTVDKLVELFQRGTGNHGATQWDALNAVTEYVDHERPARGLGEDEAETSGEESASIRASNRAESAIFGSGAVMKQKAVDYLLALNN